MIGLDLDDYTCKTTLYFVCIYPTQLTATIDDTTSTYSRGKNEDGGGRRRGNNNTHTH